MAKFCIKKEKKEKPPSWEIPLMLYHANILSNNIEDRGTPSIVHALPW